LGHQFLAMAEEYQRPERQYQKVVIAKKNKYSKSFHNIGFLGQKQNFWPKIENKNRNMRNILSNLVALNWDEQRFWGSTATARKKPEPHVRNRKIF